MTTQCKVCKRTVLIESLEDPAGICRDCYVEAQLEAEKQKQKQIEKKK